MQNFFKKISFEEIKNNLKESFQRFPVSFISIIFLFWILEFLVLKWNSLPDSTINFLAKINLSLIVVYFLWIWVKFFLNSQKNFFKIKNFFLELSPVIFWIIFFFNFEENLFQDFYFEEFIYIAITLIWVISFVFISKYILKNNNITMYSRLSGNDKFLDFFQNFFNSNSKKLENEKYFLFFTEKFSKILLSAFLWFSLTILWFAAILAVFSLFEIPDFLDKSKVFWTWAAFSLSFFAPIYFLWVVSKDEKIENFEKIWENKFYNFFIKFLALPAIILYFIILYSYSLKVLLNFQNWPEWMISWLIIFFSLFGYLIYVLSFVIQEKSSFVKKFRKYFPFAVLFQTPMFFYAIFLRINQYDFTINRYLLLVFWFYLLVISLYFIFSKNKKIVNIFSILTLFILLISISWNFSVYKFPENRQLNLLEKNLVQAWILKDWKVFLPEKYEEVNSWISWEIYNRIDYLCDFHWCNVLWKFIPEVLEKIKKEDFAKWEKRRKENIERYKTAIKEHWDEIERTKINRKNLEKLENWKYIWINSWVFREAIFEKLKVRNYFLWWGKNRNYIPIRVKYELRTEFFEIKNYDYFLKLSNWEEEFSNKKIKNEKYFWIFDTKNEKIFINKNWEKFEEFFIWDDLKKFYEKNKFLKNKYWEIELKENFSFKKKWKKMDVKIILNEFSVKNPEYSWWDDNFYNYVDWVVLIKEK